MKVPRITIEFKEEEGFAPEKISASNIVGFGIHFAWVFLFVFNGSNLFCSEASGFTEANMATWLVAYTGTLLAYGLLLKQIRRLFTTPKSRDRNRALASLAVLAAMGLAALSEALPFAAQVACGVASGLLSGVGGGVLLVSFGVSFSVCDFSTSLVSTAASMPLTSCLFAGILALDAVAHPAGVVLCACLPLAEYVLLRVSSQQLIDKLEFQTLTLPAKTKPFLRQVGLPCLAFGLLVGVLNTSIASMPEDADDPGSCLAAIALAGLAAGIVLLLLLLGGHNESSFLRRATPPIVALLLALLVLAPFDFGSSPAAFCSFAAYLLLEACVWMLLSDISQRYRITAFTTFGLGWGSLSVGATLGQLGTSCLEPLSIVAGDARMLVAVALIAITFGVALLPSAEGVRSTLQRGYYCPALMDLSVLALEKQEDGEGAGVGAEETTARGGGMGSEVQEAEEEASAGEFAADVEAAKDEDAPSAEAEPEREEQQEEEAPQHLGRFKRKCLAIAERYQLSSRETEVLFLLAKGYKSATIQENLYISEGTANTHMRHIYRKLDVHSQRELMTLVDSEQVPDEDFDL